MGGAARDLARGVATAVAHEQAAIAVRNLSSLGPSETAEIRRQFEFELKAGQPATPAANVQITISENLTEYLLVAEIQHGGERQVFLESWPRTASASTATKGAGRVTLEKKLLWEQDQPILDAAQTGDTIVVLDGTRVRCWCMARAPIRAHIHRARVAPRFARTAVGRRRRVYRMAAWNGMQRRPAAAPHHRMP